MALLLSILFLAGGCTDNASQKTDLAGIYEGDFTRGNFSTPIQFEIKKDSLAHAVYFTSPDQNAYGIPTSKVRSSADSIYFELNSDYFSFKFNNKLSEDGGELHGRLKVDSVSQPYILKRVDAATEPGFRQEEVAFESNGLTLAGTIYFPARPTDKAIYFITSSGNSDRSATRAEAIAFAEHGYVAFHIDKRGTGASEGDWQNSTIEDLATDDMNAIKFLTGKLDLPLRNIGVKGSSQGGTKVPYILSKMEDLAYGIVVSCPSTTLLESDLNYWKNQNRPLIGDLHFKDALALERLVYQYIGGMISLETLTDAIAKSKDEAWFSQVWIPNLEEVAIDTKLQYSPMPYFERTRQPLLILQGTKDEIIPEESSSAIYSVLNDRQNSKAVLLADANHSMQLVENSDFPYWPMPHPDYLPTIFKWLEGLSF